MLVQKGLVALAFSDYEAARTALEQAAALDQESPAMHVGLGYIHLRDGDRKSAHEHFERAIAVSTTAVDTVHDIVHRCTRGDLTVAAIPYAEKLVALATAAIAADPAEPYLYDYRALAYSTLDEEKLAARDLATKRSLSGWWQAEPPLEPVDSTVSP